MNKKCECGCGQFTKLAPQTDKKKGWIKSQPMRFVRGHNNRKPGTFHINNGYKIINGYFDSKKYPVKEHRLIVEKLLGRKLLSKELIHHINGNKLDNRPKNLMICTKDVHSKIHNMMSEIYQKSVFGKEDTSELERRLAKLIKPVI